MKKNHRAFISPVKTRASQIESLEGRMLLSGSPFGGGDDRFGGDQPKLIASADFNADKKLDTVSVAVQEGNGKKAPKTSTITVQLGQGAGQFTTSYTAVVSGKANAVVTGDFNGDKKLDFAVLSSTNDITVYNGDGTGKFTAQPAQNIGAATQTSNLTAGDLNGDGFTDLIAYNNQFVTRILNNGTGGFLPAVQQDNPFGSDVKIVGLGDIDGDLRPDLLGVTSTGQLLVNKALASTGEFLLTYIPTVDTSLNLAGKKILVADVNGDGANDLIAVSNNKVYVALQDISNGQISVFGKWVATSVRGNALGLSVGDVNGDGKADLVSLGSNGHNPHARLVFTGNGDGTFTGVKGPGHGHDGDDDDDSDWDD